MSLALAPVVAAAMPVESALSALRPATIQASFPTAVHSAQQGYSGSVYLNMRQDPDVGSENGEDDSGGSGTSSSGIAVSGTLFVSKPY
jgi:hypothetical protein